MSAPEDVSPKSHRELERWADARERGSVVVPSIAYADILLELTRHKFKIRDDGTPMQEWWFVVRRLGEPSSTTHRHVLMDFYDRGSEGRMAKRVPQLLNDWCFPAVTGSALDR